MKPGTLYSIGQTFFRKRVIRSIPKFDVYNQEREWALGKTVEASPKQVLMYEKTIESDDVVPGFCYVAHVFLTTDIHSNESVEVVIDDDNLESWNLVEVGQSSEGTTEHETQASEI